MVSDISHDVRVLSGHASLLFHIFLGEKRERIFCLFFTIGKIECRHLSKKKKKKTTHFCQKKKKIISSPIKMGKIFFFPSRT